MGIQEKHVITGLRILVADDNRDSADLFAMFIERGLECALPRGFEAMVTMQSWMFLSSYEKLRAKILQESSIECLVHMANMVMGIAFGTAATICKKGGSPLSRGAYCFVEYEDLDKAGKPRQFPPLNDRNLKAVKQVGAEL